MYIKPASVAYNIINGTRQLRAISKLNRYIPFHRNLCLSREVNQLFRAGNFS